MNVGFVSTRLAGNDGVSLETAKWATVLRGMGHTILYAAGERERDGPPGLLIPEAHFDFPDNLWIRAHAYGTTTAHPELRTRIARLKDAIKPPLHAFIAQYALDLIIPQNIFAIPLQLPLALALSEVIAETGIPTIAHNHDYYWEREAYTVNVVQDILEAVFPPDLPSITHVCINSMAQRDLKTRRGIDSVVVPNVFDFETPPPGIDDYNADFRAAIGLADEDWLILQPVRIIRRKGIELAIEAVAGLNDRRCKLVLSHAEDADAAYLDALQAQARRAHVDMRLATAQISSYRQVEDGRKVYSLWDAYVHADFVTYPSLYEGFGNALLEAIYFRKPVLVNRHPVYAADIGPLGFDFVELDGRVTPEAVDRMRALLHDPAQAQAMGEHNYRLALEHFSYRALAAKLAALLRRARMQHI